MLSKLKSRPAKEGRRLEGAAKEEEREFGAVLPGVNAGVANPEDRGEP